tara:strand:- start:16617 stop:17309 length:693 start_codon:yes stop_codon:yes gene_type:complete
LEINKSLVIPCKDEGPEFVIILKRFISYLKNDTEVIVVVDSKDDSTISEIEKSDLDVPILINTYGKGPAYAVRFGIDNSNGKAVCVAMGDGSDDPKQVEDLFLLIERGLSVAVASRYIRNGNYVGKKGLKFLLSKYSGFILYHFFRIGTKDPTNMFKAYSKDFMNSVKIESTNGFTLGLEMVVKAKLNKQPIGEIPTIWIDRAHGESKFNLKKFLPSYCYWVLRLVFRRK